MTFVTTVTTAICVFDVFTEMLKLLTYLLLSKLSKQRSIVICASRFFLESAEFQPNIPFHTLIRLSRISAEFLVSQPLVLKNTATRDGLQSRRGNEASQIIHYIFLQLLYSAF